MPTTQTGAPTTGTGPRSTPTATPTSTQRTSAPTGTSAGTKTMPTTQTGAPTTGTGPRSTPTATPTSTPRTSGPTGTSGVPAAPVAGKVKFRRKKFHEQYIRKYTPFFSTKVSQRQCSLPISANTIFRKKVSTISVLYEKKKERVELLIVLLDHKSWQVFYVFNPIYFNRL